MSNSTAVAMLFVIVSAISTSAIARPTTTIGDVPCKRWLDDRAAEATNKSRAALGALSGRIWIVGFMTGINAASTSGDKLNEIDADTIYDWMDQYCEDHPEESMFDGGVGLYLKLMKN